MIIISAELRNVTKKKKKALSSLRRDGYIPAVIYGKGHDNINLKLSSKEFIKQYKSGSLSANIIELNISGKKEYALVRDIQWHIVKDTIQHVDFQFVDKDSQIKIDIPLLFINENRCPGIKLGGVLNVLCRSITVKCFPNKIPNSIKVDLSGKMIGQSVHINDMTLPDGVKLTEDENFTVVTISAANSAVEESQQNQRETEEQCT